jgi:tetratricopeptide (TPR) repeat protein
MSRICALAFVLLLLHSLDADPGQADTDGDGRGDVCDCQPTDGGDREPEAVRALTRCRERAPGFDVSFNLALVRSRQGEVQNAEALFAEAVRHDRKRAVGHYYLGNTQLKLGRSEAAVQSLRTALGLEPQLVQARFALGRALNALRRYGEAAQELEAVTRALPDDPKAHYQLGIACDGMSQKARARECYRRSRTLSG